MPHLTRSGRAAIIPAGGFDEPLGRAPHIGGHGAACGDLRMDGALHRIDKAGILQARLASIAVGGTCLPTLDDISGDFERLASELEVARVTAALRAPPSPHRL